MSTNDLAAYDDLALADLFQEIVEAEGSDRLLGTGYDGDDLDQMLRNLAGRRAGRRGNSPSSRTG